jgi:hypothetical protein
MPTVQEIKSALTKSWCRETAQVQNSWSPSNPSAGQCWQSAYVVRYYLGGDIVVAELVPQTSPIQRHAWNKLPSGEEVDLTRAQFQPHQEFAPCDVPESLIWSVVGAQSELLLAKVQDILSNGASAA